MLEVHDSSAMLTYKLQQIKLLHTAVWAVMAASILALPWLGWFRRFRWAFGLTLLIVGECLVLAVNGGRCPLTDVAAGQLRYLPAVVAGMLQQADFRFLVRCR